MRKAEVDLPILRKHAERLHLTADRVLERGLKGGVSDHFGFMLFSFLVKQQEHVRSVLVLTDAGQYSDTASIARIMIEGLCTLLWCAAEPQERALQWRAYALVSDWSVLQKRKAAGQVVDPDVEQDLRERLAEYGPKYFTKAARKGGADTLDFPYQNTWHLNETGQPIGKGTLFDSVRGKELYSLYEDFSQWIHWTPAGLGVRIEHQEDRTFYNPNAYSTAAQALAAAVQSMLQTLELVYEHFRIDSEPSLKTLQAEYLKDFLPS
ncbi:MAG: hypothetical protein JWR16_1423 [Nevskia sp.]|nr:hypothetical protein [Nevskia sp.]